MFHISGIIQEATFCVWLLSPSLFSRFVQSVERISAALLSWQNLVLAYILSLNPSANFFGIPSLLLVKCHDLLKWTCRNGTVVRTKS